jgi:hypothetical protein
VANTLNALRNRAGGFIDWLDLKITDTMELRRVSRAGTTDFSGLRPTGSAVIGHRRRFVGQAWLIEIFSGRIFDPFTVFARTECVAADRRLRSDGPIGILDEQIQTEPPVSQCAERYDFRRSTHCAVGHDALREFVRPINGRRLSEERGSEAAKAKKDKKTHRPNETEISHGIVSWQTR